MKTCFYLIVIIYVLSSTEAYNFKHQRALSRYRNSIAINVYNIFKEYPRSHKFKKHDKNLVNDFVNIQNEYNNEYSNEKIINDMLKQQGEVPIID
mgnify:CR=1 FL=1